MVDCSKQKSVTVITFCADCKQCKLIRLRFETDVFATAFVKQMPIRKQSVTLFMRCLTETPTKNTLSHYFLVHSTLKAVLYDSKNLDIITTIQRAHSLETPSSFHNSRTKHNTETKLASIDFSRCGAEGCRSSWLQTLGNRLIHRSPYIRYTNRKCYLLY